ncbi:hypothetical protein WKV53_15155 [Luteolibacter sp. Y139]|uniref:Lipoprotein SmpA/OmlA domain-containing protein n=1 Tax=Luteolibacter soli TaxID=3135280 RepID=A0ABU9AVS2_9BACT
MSVAVGATSLLLIGRQKPLPEIPQSERFSAMINRRDTGAMPSLKGKTKNEIRGILGDPQNEDVEREVWIWLNDWEGYKTRGLARDWKTMATHSHADGLWIGFGSDGRASTFLYSLSAAQPPNAH